MTDHQRYTGSLQIAPIDHGIHYWENGTGKTLVFLHGALANGYTWRKILPALSESFHCIALHLPLGGHQIPLSDHVDLSPSGMAKLILQFLDWKGLKTVTLVANDTGGAYAQVFASMYPERISSLVLSNCEVLDVFPPPKFVYLRYAVHVPGFTKLMGRFFRLTSLLTHPGVMGALSSTLQNEEIAEGYLRSFVSDDGVRKDFGKACRHWHPTHTLQAAKLLKGFTKPVLILWGEHDKLFPRHQMEKLKKVFPHACWETIRHAKTYIQEDAPEQTIQAIIQFCRP